MTKSKEELRSSISHAGVLPYRVNGHGLELLLITTRGSRRWSVPKGRCRGKSDARRTAVAEAYEEAGLKGTVGKKPIGSFSHTKTGPGENTETVVLLFPMRVSRQLESWPEKGQRRLLWASPRKAAGLVGAELSALIEQFSKKIAAKGEPARKSEARKASPRPPRDPRALANEAKR